MWNLIKGAPVTAAIVFGGIAIIAGILIYAFATHKRRMAERDVGFMADRRWRLADLPLAVWYHPELPDVWRQAWETAAAVFEKAVGRDLFMRGVSAPGNLDLERMPQGNIVVRLGDPVGEMQQDHGSTELVVVPEEPKVFKCARVTCPSSCRNPVEQKHVCIHEQGHVFDLAHDDDPSSIMYHQLSTRREPGRLSDQDAERVRQVTTIKEA
jgi:hypothetical protein